MAKDKIAYVCSNCGQESTKWIGKCPSCGQWNTFKEIRIASDTGSQAARSAALSLRGGKPHSKGGKAMRLSDIPSHDEPRIDTHDAELNRVLGGGLVPGCIVLLGGEPGIGKSTLSLQTVLQMPERRILYVSGEESAHQLKMRAERLSAASPADHQSPSSDNLLILTENSLEHIFEHVKELHPELLVVDSIQTIATEEVDSSPGSLSQVRECASALLRFAKSSGVPVILIGHITKEGTLAGPKILEHIVDTVIQFEGDQHHLYRILRSMKNRFGSTSELGIYEMQQNGLRQVSNPSELLLTQDSTGLSGIAISSAIEGVRPFLVETQALVSTAAYGTPQRSATGFDQRRLNTRKARRLQAYAERCVHQHCRRTARYRPCHRPQRNIRSTLFQCRHPHRTRLVHGWRGGTVGRSAPHSTHRAAHCRGRKTRFQPYHHSTLQYAGP